MGALSQRRDVPVIVRARPAASFHGAAAGTSSLAAHSQQPLVITLRERVVSMFSKERYLVLCEIVSACWPLEAMVVDMSSAWSGMGLDWTGLDWTALQERGLDPWESGILAVSARCVLREHIAPLLRAKIVSSGGGKTRDPERNTLWLTRPYGPILSHGTTHALGGIHYHIPGIGRNLENAVSIRKDGGVIILYRKWEFLWETP